MSLTYAPTGLTGQFTLPMFPQGGYPPWWLPAPDGVGFMS